MHTIWSRLNTMMGTLLSMLGIVALFLALTTVFFEFVRGMPEPKLDLVGIELLGMTFDPTTQEEVATVAVSVNADLSSIWHLNVKMFFLYVYLESERDGIVDTVFIYDHIMQSPHMTVGPVFDKKLRGPKGTVKGQTFSVKIGWNIVPYAGILYHQAKEFQNFTIPADTEMPTINFRKSGRY
ncbi:hypothetical protein DIPPA_20499 [Diplonema papillatum]|nr:hypothetical protein DIPPA_20499 [Diplonema papillatum]